MRFLELVDRWWDVLTLMAPSAAALLVACVLGLYGLLDLYGATVALGGALVLALLVMVYVLVLTMAFTTKGVILLLRALEGWRSGDEEKSEALSSLCADNWSVELWHGRAHATMLESVVSRVASLCEEEGKAPAVLCEVARLTSMSARREILREPQVESRTIGKDEVLVLGTGRLRLEDRQNAGMAGGISMLVAGIAVLLTVEATVVADAEREACVGECSGRPVEFGQALLWLFEAFSWGVVPSGYEPATVRAKVLAFGGQALLVVLLGVVAVASRQARRRGVNTGDEVRRELASVMEATETVVVLTAVNDEAIAMRQHLSDIGPPRREHGTIFEVGMLRGTSRRVALAVVGHGNPPAAALAERAIRAFAPSALLIVGVADALGDDVELGDVVVADRVYGYHSGRETSDGFHARPRVVEMSHELLQLAGYLDRTDGWIEELPDRLRVDPPSVHLGPVAAGEQQLDSADSMTFRQLKRHYDDALAIERESFGAAYAAHLNASLCVLIIRGIGGHMDGARRRGPASADCAAAFAASVIRNMRVRADESTDSQT